MKVKIKQKYVHRQTGEAVFIWGLPNKKRIQKVSFEYLDGKSKGKYAMMNKSEFLERFQEKKDD